MSPKISENIYIEEKKNLKIFITPHKINKLSKEAKGIYMECYKALELGQKGEPLEEGLPIDPRRITLTVLKNLQTITGCKFNNTLAQYYYLGLANKYLEDKEEMSLKEVRKISR